MADRFPEQSESDLTSLVDQKNGDRMIKQFLNSVIAKYRDLSVSRRSIHDKSRYFAQPRSIIVKYFLQVTMRQILHIYFCNLVSAHSI